MISGFEKCGINPLDEERFVGRYVASSVTNIPLSVEQDLQVHASSIQEQGHPSTHDEDMESEPQQHAVNELGQPDDQPASPSLDKVQTVPGSTLHSNLSGEHLKRTLLT